MPTEFRARIEALYRAETGADDARGAQRWFARRARTNERTVRRWIAGESAVPGPIVALLDALTTSADVSRRSEATPRL